MYLLLSLYKVLCFAVTVKVYPRFSCCETFNEKMLFFFFFCKHIVNTHTFFQTKRLVSRPTVNAFEVFLLTENEILICLHESLRKFILINEINDDILFKK